MTQTKQPFFSVIIPTCDRPLVLRRTLLLFAPGVQTGTVQTDGIDCTFEVIVADDSTTAQTAEMLEAEFDWVRRVPGPGHGAGCNRNAGAQAARGSWIVLLDDDCVVQRDYLRTVRDCVEKTRALVIEGCIVCPNRTGLPWRSEPENLQGGLFWSGNIAVERATFLALGGFDPQLGRGEDLYFAATIKKNKVPAVFCAAAVAQHESEPLSARKYVDRVLSARWQLLVRLKIDPPSPLRASIGRSLVSVCRYWLALVARQFWVPLRDAYRRRCWPPITLMAAPLVNLLCLPVMLPYLTYWEYRFRRLMLGLPANFSR